MSLDSLLLVHRGTMQVGITIIHADNKFNLETEPWEIKNNWVFEFFRAKSSANTGSADGWLLCAENGNAAGRLLLPHCCHSDEESWRKFVLILLCQNNDTGVTSCFPLLFPVCSSSQLVLELIEAFFKTI